LEILASPEDQEGQEAWVQFRGHHQILPEFFQGIPWWCQRDYLM
jgi:hypothetical protein